MIAVGVAHHAVFRRGTDDGIAHVFVQTDVGSSALFCRQPFGCSLRRIERFLTRVVARGGVLDVLHEARRYTARGPRSVFHDHETRSGIPETREHLHQSRMPFANGEAAGVGVWLLIAYIDVVATTAGEQ